VTAAHDHDSAVADRAGFREAESRLLDRISNLVVKTMTAFEASDVVDVPIRRRGQERPVDEVDNVAAIARDPDGVIHVCSTMNSWVMSARMWRRDSIHATLLRRIVEDGWTSAAVSAGRARTMASGA